MRYEAIGETDIGISKHTNQDSLLIKHAMSSKGEIMMAIICDGMGGLEKGELASAIVIRAFSKWFDTEFPKELMVLDFHIIARKWELLLRDLNTSILNYGKQHQITLGTTFTGILLVGQSFLMVHVGDTRLYKYKKELLQCSEDHTFVAREIKQGRLSEEEAKYDHRRNMLLQCVGASKVVTPQILINQLDAPYYLLCSDGFRHKISKEEIVTAIKQAKTKEQMSKQIKQLIELVKSRGEKDNISAILIQIDGGKSND